MEGVAANTSFPKKERLCGRTAISQLLGKGRYGTVPGMSYLYIKDTGNDHARLLISVPKKTFKRAVKRNLYKRRIRESWRRQKHLLTEGTGIDIMIKYASKELLTYEEIYAAIGQIIEKVNRQIAKSRENEQVQSDS
ncbi:MAG: ribonuclease P protein component [Bacteroidales bacterium]|nr:ribonuclease P protein component [Bacteroidales bacterium]